MANGFKALRHVGGGVQRYTERPIASTYAANLFNGDMVTLNAGSVELATAADTDLVGSFVGCMYVNAAGSQIFSPNWVASTVGTERTALINEDDGVAYKVYALDTTAWAAGTAVDVATAASGSALTGQSGMTVVANTNNNLVIRKVLETSVDLGGTGYDVLEVSLT